MGEAAADYDYYMCIIYIRDDDDVQQFFSQF
jgi:hypothetical protein